MALQSSRSQFKMRQFPNINTQFFHIAVACDWIIFDKYSRKMIGRIMSDSQNPRWIDSFNLIIFWFRFSNFELKSDWFFALILNADWLKCLKLRCDWLKRIWWVINLKTLLNKYIEYFEVAQKQNRWSLWCDYPFLWFAYVFRQ